MKIIFAGTPDIAAPALETLLHSSHDVVAVYTQPDRPAGRGKKLTPSPVKTLALQHNIPVEQPENFKTEEARKKLAFYQADVMVVIAYGLLLPTTVLTIPKYGCINIHVSLLPRWRGAAPVQHAILAGDKASGVTIMQMDKGLDTGKILAQTSCSIHETDTSESLFIRLSDMAQPLLLSVLTQIETHSLQPIEQHNHHATYAHKIEKNHAKIDWHETSEIIDRKVRAYYPAPIAFFDHHGELIRVWAGHIQPDNGNKSPGEIIDITKQGVIIKTGDGAFCITRLQFPGKNPLSGADLCNASKSKFRLS